MTFKEARDVYWKYFISLEQQFLETGRYVEFDIVNNGKTYSIEYLKLFQAVCSEIDVVGKVLAKELDSSIKPNNKPGLNEWWFFITNVDADIIEKKCSLFGENAIQPWKGFIVVKNPNTKAKHYILEDNANTPSWWVDYNNVKHKRTDRDDGGATNYTKANLQNLLSAFAALFIIEVKLMETVSRDNGETVPLKLESQLFKEKLPFYTYYLNV